MEATTANTVVVIAMPFIHFSGNMSAISFSFFLLKLFCYRVNGNFVPGDLGIRNNDSFMILGGDNGIKYLYLGYFPFSSTRFNIISQFKRLKQDHHHPSGKVRQRPLKS